MTTRLSVLLLLLVSLAACDAAAPDAGTCVSSTGFPQAPASCGASIEICRIGDGGWSAQCRDGVVRFGGATTYVYCVCGTTEESCRVVVPGARGPFTCATGCLDTEEHLFDLYSDFTSFPAESLCGLPPT